MVDAITCRPPSRAKASSPVGSIKQSCTLSAGAPACLPRRTIRLVMVEGVNRGTADAVRDREIIAIRLLRAESASHAVSGMEKLGTIIAPAPVGLGSGLRHSAEA